MKKTKVLIFALSLLFITGYSVFAQEDNKFKDLKDTYFRDNKYAEFVDYLNSLSLKDKSLEPEVNYYIALSRYHQLKHLEETQNWDEYFGQGNAYKDQVVLCAQKAIDSTKTSDALNIYARMLLWQFHKDNQDAFEEVSLSELMNSVIEYSNLSLDQAPVKEAADKLSFYQEKGKSKELYKVYAGKIIASKIEDSQLKNIAFGFYKEGNLELAELVYDSYIDRVSKALPKDKVALILIDIAKLFAYKNEGPNDMLYAENIFKKAEEAGTRAVFNEELMYLRAFNLEKAKDFPLAKERYIDLTLGYPQSGHLDEANYKIGIIHTYVLKEKKMGKEYFEKLSQKEVLSPQAISSLYQLGLLCQWENDLPKAKDYYSTLIEKANGGFAETVALAKERLKEIEESKAMEYNLKTFLDVSLQEGGNVEISQSLSASKYILKENGEVRVGSYANLPISGCMPVELQYLWSGHLGKPEISAEELPLTPSFNTSYLHTGTKEINLVVISTSGVIDCGIDMADVY